LISRGRACICPVIVVVGLVSDTVIDILRIKKESGKLFRSLLVFA
jgi:hypothetical protein